MGSVLKVNAIGKTFKKVRAIEKISFDVQSGEIMAILGPNGAGKSTTIRSIMGILVPDEGTIEFQHGRDGEIPRHKIGYLPEERGLFKNVPIIDILLFFAELKNYPLDRARKRIKEYLEKFDLAGKEKHTVEQLSKGMAQKVQFIASIIHEPELLVLDEPFSGLDPVSQEVFQQEIRDLTSDGTAILLSSHQMNLVEALCDRLFMIHRGRKVIYDSLDRVKARYANFKCTLKGDHHSKHLDRVPGVNYVDQRDDRTVLYLQDDVNPTHWLRSLPEELDIQEMSLDRISLHEIFVQIATGAWEHREGDDA